MSSETPQVEQLIDLNMVGGTSMDFDRYRPATPGRHVSQIVRSLGYFGDVEDDPELPPSKAQLKHCWEVRQPEIARRLS